MLSRKGVINVVSLLLVIVMVLSIASGLYLWFAKIQSEAQQTTTHYSDETLTNVITEIKIVDDPIYNTLAEGKQCIPATITMSIQNTGAKKLAITNDSEIIVSDGNGPICLSTFTGACVTSENRLYVGKQNSAGNTSNISYSTDGTTWVAADNIVGTNLLASSLVFDNNIYFGGYYENPVAGLTGAQVFKSCNYLDFIASTAIYESTKINALEEFDGNIYASTSGLPGGGPSWIYKYSQSELAWNLVNTTLSEKITSLEVFGDYIYSGIAYEENLSRSSDGEEWILVEAGLGNITSLFTYDGKLYAGLDDGKIWRSADGTNFGGAEVVATGDEGVLAFEEFNGNLYAGTNKSGAASIWEYDGDSWNERYDAVGNSDNDSVNDFAVIEGYIYAVLSGNGGGAILRSADGITWTEAYSEDSVTNFTTIVNYTYCSDEKISCVQGCGSEIVPGETRTLELQLSNTDCDISGYGTTTDYSFRINFGSAASVSGRFGKEVESSTSNSLCEYTYPLCNGACSTGNCAKTELPGMNECICVPAFECEAVPIGMFDCSIGICGIGECILFEGDRCSCAG